jgi:hypothetical protein
VREKAPVEVSGRDQGDVALKAPEAGFTVEASRLS